MSYTIRTHPAEAAPAILVVGCGGTGGFLAESIARLLLGRDAMLCLVDMDRVEPRNAARQAFRREDVGRFKAQVLAERMAERYGLEVRYSVLPYDRALHARAFDGARGLKLVTGCVDNAPARRAMAETLGSGVPAPYGYSQPREVWWLDCGNGRNSGQVLLGSVTSLEELKGSFREAEGVCTALPAPSVQSRELLDAPPVPEPELDCAERIERNEQGPTINQVIAALAASYVEKLLNGSCSWMASYVDMDAGTLATVAADPKVVSRVSGLHPNSIVSRARVAKEDAA
ncbi:MAG: ThiF family adenylyltransferase [Chloroflexota bacterium]|nr:ThiF family adenylyltransferase [Chloroflexota bacterium]